MPMIDIMMAEAVMPKVEPTVDRSEPIVSNNETITPTTVPWLDSPPITPTTGPWLDSPPITNSTPAAQINPALMAELESLRANLHQDLQMWIAAGDLARPNGYVYAVDLGQLLLYFANQDDLENYTSVRKLAMRNLILDDPSDPYTQGFVGWRYSPTEALDASSTSEGLLVAKALWRGFQQFYDPVDEELSLLILEGYAKHAFVDQEIWLIRNYFNLKTRSFAPNSYLVNYDPDFVQEVAESINNSDLAELAQNSNDLIRQGQAPSGLLHTMVLPEVKILYPDSDIVVFSPNDIIQFSNACAIAEKVIKNDPELARQTLGFAESKLDTLMTYYYGQTGNPVTEEPARLSEWSCLVRVAAKLNEPALTEHFIERALPFWKSFDEQPGEPRLYQTGQILLAIDAVVENDILRSNSQ